DDGRGDEARDLTPDARLDYEGVDDAAFDVSPDGKLAVTSVLTFDDEGKFIQNLQLLDVATGGKRALTTVADSYISARFSPDGKRVACLFHEKRPKKTGRTVLAVIDVATGKVARPCDALDLWPNAPVWSSDGATIWFTADERGDVPIFAVDVASGRVRRVAVGG